MWVAKIVVPANEGMLIASRTKRHKVTVMGYPLTNYSKNGKVHLLASAYLVGEHSAKRTFLQDLKSDKRAVRIDMTDENFGFWLMEQPTSIKVLYDPLIIHIKPAIISKDGDNIWEIASWDKKKLMAVAKMARSKAYGGKLVSIKQQKIKNIAIITAFPQLTDKQQRAIELAIENGYYGYPRKTELGPLAKLMGVSYSTYQFHLRTAEKKLMPYIYRR